MGGEVVDFAVTSRSGRGLARSGVWGLLLVLVCLPAMAAEFPTKNKHLQTALKLFDDVEYEKALLALDKAEQWPSNTQEDKVFIALLEGVLSYETQQPARGDRAFQRALELDRKVKLTLVVSPKVAAKLEELRAKLPSEKPPVVEPPPPLEVRDSTAEPRPTGRMNLKLPVAIGGGVVAVGGILSLTRAKSLEGKVRNADASITTRARLEDTLGQARTFEKVGWVLMGLGAATTAGSLLFLNTPAEEAKATVTPVAQGAQLSISWSLR
jgi:hypothetical protein